MRATFLALLCLTGPSMAQERITPEAFLAQVVGKTATVVHYKRRNLVGVEQFLDSARSVWARADGTCTYGHITQEAGMVCFAYEDEPLDRRHCWIPFQQGTRLFVVFPNGREIQEVVELTDAPVTCTPAPTS